MLGTTSVTMYMYNPLNSLFLLAPVTLLHTTKPQGAKSPLIALHQHSLNQIKTLTIALHAECTALQFSTTRREGTLYIYCTNTDTRLLVLCEQTFYLEITPVLCAEHIQDDCQKDALAYQAKIMCGNSVVCQRQSPKAWEAQRLLHHIGSTSSSLFFQCTIQDQHPLFSLVHSKQMAVSNSLFALQP